MKRFMQYITEVKSERIKVYRLGSRQDNLIGKNAASIEGVIKFIDQQDRRGIGTGSYISAYEVEVMGGFGKYASMEGSKDKSHTPNESGPLVGRDISGNPNWQSVWYSFPKDGSWKLVKKLKTRSISELDKETEKLKIDDGFGNITKKWESLGWVKQKEVAEKLFR